MVPRSVFLLFSFIAFGHGYPLDQNYELPAEGRQLIQGSPPAIFPAISMTPAGAENPAPSLIPFRPFPGIRVTLIDRNELIDRLVARLESLRVTSEGTPQQLPVRAVSSDGSPSTSVISTPTTSQTQSPLVAIANFFDRLFTRQPGYHEASQHSTVAGATNEKLDAVAADEQKKVEGESAAETTAYNAAAAAVSSSANVAAEAETVKKPFVEVIPYRSGALVHRTDGKLVYYPSYSGVEKLPTESPSQEYLLGYIAPPRPTIRQSFQDLFNIQELPLSGPLLSGAPGYQNVVGVERNVPYYYYRQY